ncbi:MAG: hypothetical protein ACE5FO_02815 [Parvularculaceae bacterium]
MANYSTNAAVAVSSVEKPAPGADNGRAIVHPLVDFLCLGGASLIIIPATLMLPSAAAPAMIAVMWMLADILNHPHFTASYLIFYRGYGSKISSKNPNRGLRLRYLFSGVVVPAALVFLFGAAFLLESPRILGWSGNLMLLLVGWHYAKQGYGMLIVDSVYNRLFFNDSEKKILLYNAYACWIMFWLSANWLISERALWGLHYYSFAVPEAALWAAGAAVALTTLLTLRIFWTRLRPGGAGLPLAGAAAYLTSLYFWAAARLHPVALIFVPAFHSLQYLFIVWRFETNRARNARLESDAPPAEDKSWPVFRFGATAFLLGLALFWWAPKFLNGAVDYNAELFGGYVFLFMFWIFINIHHYFIDNVIWRGDNPETGKSLFGVSKKANPA